MVKFTKPFFPLLLAVLLSSCAHAVPWPSAIKLTTHRTHQTRDARSQFQSFHPASKFKTFQDPVAVFPLVDLTDDPNDVPGMAQLRRLAFSYVNSQGVALENVALGSAILSNVTRVAYLKQIVNGIPVANTAASVAFNADDKVLTYSTSFAKITSATKIADPIPNPTFDFKFVLANLENLWEASLLEQNNTLHYLARPDGSLSLMNVIQLRNIERGARFEVFIDANSGQLRNTNDFGADASYTVVPVDRKSIEDIVETVSNPADIVASPEGWHGANDQSAFAGGNNALVLVPGQEALLKQSSSGSNFNYFYDSTQGPTSPNNQNAARANAFYVANMVHDVAYRYGFTEDKFNFQSRNFGKGGKDNDAVILTVQDTTSGNRIGRFITPPDGESPFGKIFLWNSTTPGRDGAMENDILIHELAHGITGRLTGGGTARCLQTPVAVGLGEGWSDMFANWFQQTSVNATDFSFGSFVTGVPRGLRTFPYSSDPRINPLKFRHLEDRAMPHEIGEVWATMLHDIYAKLVEFGGYSADRFTNPDSFAGNVVFMRLLMDSLSLQPCNPTFLDARAAWFAADRARYRGGHFCVIARAFAGRGFGEKSDGSFKDDNTLPDGCSAGF